MRIFARVVSLGMAGLAGFAVGGLLGGGLWLIFVDDANVGGGSGDDRYGQAWFGIGGMIGLVVAVATAVAYLALRSGTRSEEAR